MQSVFILLTAILIARLPLCPPRFHPTQLLNLFFSAIADKVNNAQRSQQQQYIAGNLALITMLGFILMITAVIQFIVIEPILFEFVLLLCLLQWEKINLPKVNLGNLEKKTIISQIQPRTLRDLDQLSLLGVHKASIENLCLRNSYQWFTVIFWYISVGIWAAIIYRAIQLMAHNWNSKLPVNHQFGRPAAALLQLLASPAHLILACTLRSLQRATSPLSNLNQQAKQWHHFSTGFLLSSFAYSLAIQLGGPRKYQGSMRRFSQLGHTQPAQRDDIKRAQQKLTLALIIWLCFISAIYLLISIK
ncbi:Adenosylcobinamide-phosphate synthase [Moritella sp. JT01]|uniref:cobalamin biosynthesis protein CobD/CbiB n=1 Tax=Moritella sp. JT01 TaxID=756698 RepID=UPI000798129D|nr:cobalamin biosynthesis protein [Moritella sp. JT01]KXO14039.1 Adenosylcobinamide-phosphate synthase [Moritella sp. JT01]